MPSIAQRRIMLVDIAEIESKPHEFRKELVIALSITDKEFDLEWECIKRQLTPCQKIIGNMLLRGYKQREIAEVLDISQQTVSYQWKLVITKIKKLYKL